MAEEQRRLASHHRDLLKARLEKIDCKAISCRDDLVNAGSFVKRLDRDLRFVYQGKEISEEYSCVATNPTTATIELNQVCEAWRRQTVQMEELRNRGAVYQRKLAYRGAYGSPQHNSSVLLKHSSFTGATRKATSIKVVYHPRYQLCIPGLKAPVTRAIGELPVGMAAHSVRFLTAIQEQQHEEILKDLRAYDWVRQHLVDKSNLYSLKHDCGVQEEFAKAYPFCPLTFEEWYQLNFVYFVDVTSGALIYFGNPGYVVVRTFVPRLGQTSLTHRLYKIRDLSTVKKGLIWKIQLTSEEQLEACIHLRRREDLTHTNWIPMLSTRFELETNSVLELKVDGWQGEQRVLRGVPLSKANEENREWFMQLERADLGRAFSNRLFLPFSFCREKTTSLVGSLSFFSSKKT